MPKMWEWLFKKKKKIDLGYPRLFVRVPEDISKRRNCRNNKTNDRGLLY